MWLYLFWYELLVLLVYKLVNICILVNFLGIINSTEESLFTYNGEESWSTFYQPDFVPFFEPTFSNSLLEQQANTICGDDVFCRYDIAATGRVDVGRATLEGNMELERIINISLPGTMIVIATCFPTLKYTHKHMHAHTYTHVHAKNTIIVIITCTCMLTHITLSSPLPSVHYTVYMWRSKINCLTLFYVVNILALSKINNVYHIFSKNVAPTIRQPFNHENFWQRSSHI